MYIYIHTHTHTQLNHFVIQQKLTQHCKSTILEFKKKIHPSEVKIKENFQRRVIPGTKGYES